MKKTLILVVILAALVIPCLTAAAQPTLSVDPASPAIDGDITPDDVLGVGPVVVMQGAILGLLDRDNLDALSNGRNSADGPLFFSVDRVARGLAGAAVSAQSIAAEAAADVFVGVPPSGTNQLLIDEQQLGLSPGFFGDDLDALEPDLQPLERVYFSLDQNSPNSGPGRSGDVFVGNLATLFADGELHLGLQANDDLDALAVDDTFQPGVLNPGIDRALFSLSTFSPSTYIATGNPYLPGVPGALSPADILLTDFSGGYSLWAAAADIGLASDDELDALATVPEPGTLTAFGLGLLCACALRRIRHGDGARPPR